MKKTLAAVALLGAFAGSAMADVTVYGAMDMSMHWNHVDGKDTVAMESGNNETTMVGFKGSEKISDGLTAGFKLEAAFDADTGANTTHGLFKRESLVYLKGTYGELGLGRTGSLDASTGSYAFFGSARTGFGGGYAGIGAIENVLIGKGGRLDNAMTYVSPSFAGVTVYAQAATAQGEEYTQNVDRSYALGARYAAGAFGAGLVAKVMDYSQDTIDNVPGSDDATVVTAYATYDFGVAKVFAAAQHFDGVKAVYNKDDASKNAAGVEGYGLTLAVSAPVCGGTAKAIVGYGEQEDVVSGAEQTNKMVGAFYDYPLSKRTGLYTALGYNVQDKKSDVKETWNGLVGLYHKF